MELVEANTERRMSLYEIDSGLEELLVAREEVTDPEEIAAVDSAIAEYIEQRVQKVDSIRGYIRHGEMLAATAQEEAARATEVAKAWRARVDRVKRCCLDVMQSSGKKRLDGKGGYLIVKGNGGLAPLTVQDDVLPDEYRDATVKMPLTLWRKIAGDYYEEVSAIEDAVRVEHANGRIREALKDGPVPGARLEERGTHLEVK